MPAERQGLQALTVQHVIGTVGTPLGYGSLTTLANRRRRRGSSFSSRTKDDSKKEQSLIGALKAVGATSSGTGMPGPREAVLGRHVCTKMTTGTAVICVKGDGIEELSG